MFARVVLSDAPDWFFFRTDGGAMITLKSSLDDQRARVVDANGATVSEFAYSVSDLPMAALSADTRR